MRRLRCHHELVVTEESGVYRCRLCGATLRERKPDSRMVRLCKHWILAITSFGVSSSVFIFLALPCIITGGVPGSLIQRDVHPNLFWGFASGFIIFSVVTLTIALAEFRSIWKEKKSGNDAAQLPI